MLDAENRTPWMKSSSHLPFLSGHPVTLGTGWAPIPLSSASITAPGAVDGAPRLVNEVVIWMDFGHVQSTVKYDVCSYGFTKQGVALTTKASRGTSSEGSGLSRFWRGRDMYQGGAANPMILHHHCQLLPACRSTPKAGWTCRYDLEVTREMTEG